MSDSTLTRRSSMARKVRLLTKSPSESQLQTSVIDDGIDRFMLYEMPTDVGLNTFRTVLSFYTEPYKDKYGDSSDISDPLYDFKNRYIVSADSAFISGNFSSFTQSRNGFYDKYPRSITKKSIGTGDGATSDYSDSLYNAPVLARNIVFATLDVNDNYLSLNDDGLGNLTGDGSGNIDYITGEYNIAFSENVKNDEDIYVQSCSYTPSKPDTVLFYGNEFTLRPIPDNTYQVEIEVLKRPTQLLNDSDTPELYGWWDYIAIGVARNILFERGDFEIVAILDIELERKREQVLYKSVIENSEDTSYGI